MYSLMLTAEERRAFDWVGDRYSAGKVTGLLLDCIPEDRAWSDDGDITPIPEHVEWEIRDLAEEEDFSWACFAPQLVSKVNDLCWSIV